MYRDDTGQRMERGGKPVQRLGLPPCGTCPKTAGLAAAERDPRHGQAATLSDGNWRLLQLYWETDGRAPRYAYLRRLFGIVRRTHDDYRRAMAERTADLLRLLVAR